MSYHLYTGSDRSLDLRKDLTDLLVVNHDIVSTKGTKTVMIVSHIVIVMHIVIVSLIRYTV